MEILQSPGQLLLRASQNRFSHKVFSSRVKNPLQNWKITARSNFIGQPIKLSGPIVAIKPQSVVRAGFFRTKDIILFAAIFIALAQLIIWAIEKVEIGTLFKNGAMASFLSGDEDIIGIVKDTGIFTITLRTLQAKEVIVRTQDLTKYIFWISDGSHAPIIFVLCMPLSCVPEFESLAEKTKIIMNEVPGIERDSLAVHLNEITNETAKITVVCKVQFDGLDAYFRTKSKILATTATIFLQASTLEGF